MPLVMTPDGILHGNGTREMDALPTAFATARALETSCQQSWDQPHDILCPGRSMAKMSPHNCTMCMTPSAK